MEHIRNIEIGEAITDYFSIRRMEVRHHDGRAFIFMELGCSRGRIRAFYWGEDAAELSDTLMQGDVIKIQGHGTEYKDLRQLKIERLRKAKPDEIAKEKLLPQGKYTSKVLWSRFRKLMDSIENPHFNELLRKIFIDDKKFSKRFVVYPAAKLWHGAYVGGLIEHTLRVAKICQVVWGFYPKCRKELLLTGAILHDIGKVDEISMDGYFEYSVKGRLIGHIALGAMRIDEAIRKQTKFPKKLENELMHIILSHHGTNEMGSPVEPKTLEAMILHHADMLDAQAEGIQHIIQRDLPRGREFSDYVKILSRFIYLSGYRDDE